MQSENPIGALEMSAVPQHIGIIMDGNQRWARKRSLPIMMGHQAGAKNIRRVIKACSDRGIGYLTLFAFSTENWQRPEGEVTWLLNLMVNLLEKDIKELHANNIKLTLIGDRARFSKHIQRLITEAEQLTKDNTRLFMQIAASYGGRWDIARAAKSLAEAVSSGELDPKEVDEHTLAQFTSLAGLPSLDLCIRTGGEQRLSNFLLWDLAYSELYFTPTYWPDFDDTDLTKALQCFAMRQRRFGQNEYIP